MSRKKELFVNLAQHVSSSLSEHDFQLYVPLFPVLTHFPFLLLLSRDDNQIPPNTRTAGLSGRLAIQVRWHVMSPTPLLRSVVWRLLLFTIHPGGQGFAQYTTPMRMARLHPCLRKWMRDTASKGWLHRCPCRRERQVQPLQELKTLQENICGTFITLSKHRESYCDTLAQAEIEQTNERIRYEQQEVRDFLKFHA